MGGGGHTLENHHDDADERPPDELRLEEAPPGLQLCAQRPGLRGGRAIVTGRLLNECNFDLHLEHLNLKEVWRVSSLGVLDHEGIAPHLE